MIHSNNLEILKLLLLFPISTIQQFFRDMIASIDRVRSRKKKKFAGELGWTVSNGIFWRCTCFIECMILHLCGSDPADAFVRGVLYLCLALASRNSWRKRKERKTRDQRWFSDRKFRRKFIARDKSGNLRIILESRRAVSVLSSLANLFSLENIRSTISKRSYGIQILNQCNCIESEMTNGAVKFFFHPVGKIILLRNPFSPYYYSWFFLLSCVYSVLYDRNTFF